MLERSFNFGPYVKEERLERVEKLRKLKKVEKEVRRHVKTKCGRGKGEVNYLHDRLITKLKRNNLPQLEGEKYYFREVVVGWKALGINFDFKDDVLYFIEGVSRMCNEGSRIIKSLEMQSEELEIIKKLVEQNLICKGMFWMVEITGDKHKLNLLKYIDCVCIVKSSAWIIEAKKRLNYEAVGQVNVLSYLFSRDYPQFSIKKAIVCEETDPLIESFCKEFNIQVFHLSH